MATPSLKIGVEMLDWDYHPRYLDPTMLKQPLLCVPIVPLDLTNSIKLEAEESVYEAYEFI